MKTNKNNNGEEGFVLIAILILTALALTITAATLTSTANISKAHAVVKIHNNRYYDVEDSLGKVTAWLQDNSKYLVSAFTAANFSTNFSYTEGNAPTIGTNEATHFGVPTSVKMNGTTNSVMISNNSTFGSSSFPSVTHIEDGDSKNLVTTFNSAFPDADNGGVNLRVVLLSVKSAGADYSPIFRVDAITGNDPDRGVHMFTHIAGAFVDNMNDDSGFYGENYADLGGTSFCKSKTFTWSGSKWNIGKEAFNCNVQSQGNIIVSSSATIHGKAETNKANGISASSESKITASNSAGCEGPGCHSTTLVPASLWAAKCPSGGDIKTISSNTTLSIGDSSKKGADGVSDCYEKITVNNQKTLTLDSSNDVGNYYVKTFTMSGGQPELKINPSASDKVIELHIETMSNGHINGKEVINKNAAPHQLKIVYTGSSELKLNGGTDIRAHLYAPFARIYANGNFQFYGKVNALEFKSSGTADLFSDEVNSSSTASPAQDLAFANTRISQRFR